MKALYRPCLKILPLAGLLFLAACPQMTTGAISGAGAPLSATGEKTNSTTDTTDKGAGNDEFAPPPAAVPVPLPSGGGDAGGLGGEGSGNPEYAARMLTGPSDGSPVGEPIRVARESGGGVLSSPSPSEHIETFKANVRILGWPLGVQREWTDASDFFRKITACRSSGHCELKEEISKKVIVMNGSLPLEGTVSERGLAFVEVFTEAQVPDEIPVPHSGHYLYFVTKDHQTADLGGAFEEPPTLDELMALATDDRLKLVAEKDTYFYLFPTSLDPLPYFRTTR
ncbi:MAG TPA: hypothetical protein VFX30_10955 [bacterium]|nr:hypothetical protein [bacterium]